MNQPQSIKRGKGCVPGFSGEPSLFGGKPPPPPYEQTGAAVNINPVSGARWAAKLGSSPFSHLSGSAKTRLNLLLTKMLPPEAEVQRLGEGVWGVFRYVLSSPHFVIPQKGGQKAVVPVSKKQASYFSQV